MIVSIYQTGPRHSQRRSHNCSGQKLSWSCALSAPNTKLYLPGSIQKAETLSSPRMPGSDRTTNTHSPLTAEWFFLSRVEKCLHHRRVFVQQVVFPTVSIVAYETSQKHQRVLHEHESPRGCEGSLQLSPAPSTAPNVRTGEANRNILSMLLHLAGCPHLKN